MKNKLLVLLMLITLALASSALAGTNITAMTITAPTASIRGTAVTATASWTGNASAQVVDNITFYNDTLFQTVLCTITDLRTDDGSGSCTFDSSAFADNCTGVTIFAAFQNQTQNIHNTSGLATAIFNDTQAGIIYDNTNATLAAVTSEFSGSQQQLFEDHEYSFTVADNCVAPVSFVELTKPDNRVVNKTGTTGTWRSTDVDMIGTYSAEFVSTDVAGGKSTSIVSFSVGGKDDSADLVVLTQQQVKKATIDTGRKNALIGAGVVVVILLGGIGAFLFSKGNK